jgi:rSAM/selenodomain-associated transferase 1
MTEKRLLLIFVKNPILGKVKTRLAQTIGSEKALAVYHQLLAHTLAITEKALCQRAVFYSDFIESDGIWADSDFKKYVQIGNDLGERMQHAFAYAFDNGYTQVVIIGSDCLPLTTEHINRAFDLLDTHNAVIGPAVDGGYYLLGLTNLPPGLFTNKLWSSPSVFTDTITDFQRLQVNVSQLETLRDLDTEEDLKILNL